MGKQHAHGAASQCGTQTPGPTNKMKIVIHADGGANAGCVHAPGEAPPRVSETCLARPVTPRYEPHARRTPRGRPHHAYRAARSAAPRCWGGPSAGCSN